MKRSAIKRSTPLVRTAGPARATIKLPKCIAPGCRERFVPERKSQEVCGPDCAEKLVADRAAKAARKAEKQRKAAQKIERENDKERREALKSISQLETECREIVQEIARLRDRDDGCISCHMGPNYTGVWHGSHYRAHGGCSSLQFHLWNIHKACEQCNFFKGGNREGFIQGLLAKPGYGPERLEWLDAQPKSQRFTRDYLTRFKRVMGKRRTRMKQAIRRAG